MNGDIGLHLNPQLFRSLNRQTASQRDLAQAVPRPTRVRFFVSTTGIGEVRLVGTEAINFATFFLEEPTTMFGCELPNGDPGVGALPLATACVIAYVRDDNNLYVGAEMGFRVDSSNSGITVDFSLTFEGYALRAAVKSA